jgi:hypothetical protein
VQADADAGDDEPVPPRRRRRRGLFARLARLSGLAGEAGHAAVSLLHAETRLARAALPHAVAWLCVSVLFVGLAVASLWGAIALGLYRWTGSAGAAIAWLAGGSVLGCVVAVWMLLRALRAIGYPESRRRIAAWLERSERKHGVQPGPRES